jgi:hypothetical protein
MQETQEDKENERKSKAASVLRVFQRVEATGVGFPRELPKELFPRQSLIRL